jgi:hypothetical protein
MPTEDQRPRRIHRRGRPGVPTHVVTISGDQFTPADIALRKQHLIAQIMAGVPVNAGGRRDFAMVKEIAYARRTVRITFDHHRDLARADTFAGEHPVNRVCGWTTLDFVESFAPLYAAALGLPVSRVDL